MESVTTGMSNGLALLGFSIGLLLMALLLIRVFIKAINHKSEAELANEDEIHNFDYSESHRLLLEREDIVQMTEQGYYDPMDQVFSLQRWKQKVARYIQNYDHYLHKRD